MARRSKAEEAASALIQRYRITEPPVPVEKIAEMEGAEIVRSKSQGNEAGFALRDNGRTLIGVNAGNNRLRQRFTIAHELGHLALHPGKPLIVDPSVRINLRNEVSSLGTDFEEIQANLFAAELLMPRMLVIRLVSELASTTSSHENAVTSLADLFEVSKEAMSYRLINLGIVSA
jgi:Zn-dependent peptidase ImmA (M78 family)